MRRIRQIHETNKSTEKEIHTLLSLLCCCPCYFQSTNEWIIYDISIRIEMDFFLSWNNTDFKKLANNFWKTNIQNNVYTCYRSIRWERDNSYNIHQLETWKKIDKKHIHTIHITTTTYANKYIYITYIQKQMTYRR